MTDPTTSTTPSSAPDPALARQLLARLGRDTFEFRCIMDEEKRKSDPSWGMRRYCGPFNADVAARLSKLNAHGYGIFVQVNEHDGAGYAASNIVAAPCFFVDLDGVPRENLQRLALPPHLVVETSPGKWHAYWRIADLPLDRFTPTQRRLVKLFNSDKSVVDLPRVMRLPGFLHQKNPAAPHLVQPVEVNDQAPFTYAEFEAALTAAEQQYGTAPAAVSPAGAATAAPASSDLHRSEQALRHLIKAGQLNPGDYTDWLHLAFALKSSHGEAGWLLWHALSREAAGYEGETACRRKWETVGAPADGKALTMASFIKQARAAGWTPDTNDAGEAPRSSKGPDPAAYVVQLADAEGDEFWLDDADRPHVSFRIEHDGAEVVRHAKVASRVYRDLLQQRYFMARGNKVLSAEHTKQAVDHLAARTKAACAASGGRHRAPLRVGEYGGRIYVDLGRADGRAVEVTADGWQVVTSTPVRFVRGSRHELPLPERGGTLADFRRHFHLTADNTIRLVAAAMAALAPAETYPICLIEGEQGSGKSTFGDMVVALTDPMRNRKDARFSFSPDERGLHIHASGVHVLYFDNISTLDPDQADVLCRVATGGASSFRKLHTDDEEVLFSVTRPVVATCIATPSPRGDFLDRCVRITAQPVVHRQTEKKVWAAFEQDRPKLFGFLLSALACALRNRDAVQQAVDSGRIALPRLADFALLVEAAAEELGLRPGEFSAMLRDEQAVLQTEAALGDPIVAGLQRHFSEPGAAPLEVTSSELLAKLKPADSPSQQWPRPNRVRSALTRNAAGLRAIGIEVEECKPKGHDNVFKFRISATPAFRAAEAGDDEAAPFSDSESPF